MTSVMSAWLPGMIPVKRAIPSVSVLRVCSTIKSPPFDWMHPYWLRLMQGSKLRSLNPWIEAVFLSHFEASSKPGRTPYFPDSDYTARQFISPMRNIGGLACQAANEVASAEVSKAAIRLDDLRK
jgi:hypothetical protein